MINAKHPSFSLGAGQLVAAYVTDAQIRKRSPELCVLDSRSEFTLWTFPWWLVRLERIQRCDHGRPAPPRRVRVDWECIGIHTPPPKRGRVSGIGLSSIESARAGRLDRWLVNRKTGAAERLASPYDVWVLERVLECRWPLFSFSGPSSHLPWLKNAYPAVYDAVVPWRERFELVDLDFFLRRSG